MAIIAEQSIAGIRDYLVTSAFKLRLEVNYSILLIIIINATLGDPRTKI